ncbi:unnamed protein product [Brassicogethes aeneus]|uniref:Kinase n=1 Tax=Brassicogethes aeneus TaxID=1431903 RepID=A0A9P0FPZ4_BRAAE|nr:unnamed protein product [Brassicogethes aeneus]
MGKADVASMPLHHESGIQICVPPLCKPLYMSPTSTNITNGIIINNNNNNKNTSTVVANGGKGGETIYLQMPSEMEILGNQVAGHMNDGKCIGMIKHNDTVLKPTVAKECHERENYFYRELSNTVDRSMIPLRDLVPKYHGNITVPINGKDVECIALEDLTKDFKEPCIMDIKIGRRTWDPKASYQKIMSEEKKYIDCRRDLGFCIPGFQVYKVFNDELCKFGKDYGKQLDKESAIDAIKMFLNADQGFCRSLIVQILATLWRIQHWARNQQRLRLYSSSILLIYDARRLRECIKKNLKSTLKLQRKNSLYRPMSLAVGLNNDSERIQTGFSGQLTKDGPILKSSSSHNKIVDFNLPNPVNVNNTWQKSIKSLKRTHSFQNNYDKDVQNRKRDYTYMLDELCCENKSECWANVKMIDFSHVYSAENCDIDKNYLDGIENLVAIFEDFLVESE